MSAKGMTKIRPSPYRHLYAEPLALRYTYGDICIGSVSGESSVLSSTSSHIAVPWTDPGSVCIIPQGRYGTVAEATPLLRYRNEDLYETAVNEIALCPTNEQLLAVAGQDGCVGVWRFPAGGLEADQTEVDVRARVSASRTLSCGWHPLAAGVFWGAAGDKSLAFFDLEAGGAEKMRLPGGIFKGLLTNASWNLTGSLMSTCSKDKKLRLWDVRAAQLVAEVDDHASPKSAHCQYMSRCDLIVTAGFTRSSEREIAVYDPRNLEAGRLHTEKLGQSSSSVMLFEDYDLSICYAAGKGDTTISYFEITPEAPSLWRLSEYKSNTPQNGLTLLPKKCGVVKKCEIDRFLKLSGNRIEPLRFQVPRRIEGFQSDLYPDTFDGQPALTAEEWFAGEDAMRNTVPVNYDDGPEV